MHLTFPYHFQFRLHERNLNVEDIKLAIRIPDFQKDSHEGRTIVRKEIAGKILEVIYLKNKHKTNEYAIITSYYIK